MDQKETYPPPPPYYHLYTDEARDNPDPTTKSLDIWTAPDPIRPPASFEKFGEPQTGTYLQHELPPDCPKHFDDSGHIDFIGEIRRLNRSVMEKYIELLSCLLVVEGPEVEAKVNEISHLFFNISHLLNRLRAHQARQTLISVMTRQIKERNKKAAYLEQRAEEAKQFLAAHGLHFDDDGNTIKADRRPVGRPASKPPSTVSSGQLQHSDAQMPDSQDEERLSAWAGLMGALDSIAGQQPQQPKQA